MVAEPVLPVSGLVFAVGVCELDADCIFDCEPVGVELVDKRGQAGRSYNNALPNAADSLMYRKSRFDAGPAPDVDVVACELGVVDAFDVLVFALVSVRFVPFATGFGFV